MASVMLLSPRCSPADTAPAGSVPLQCQADCPLHTTSSGADVTNELAIQFLGQNLKSNTLELEYDFTPAIERPASATSTPTGRSPAISATFDTGETYFPGGPAGHRGELIFCGAR